MQIIVDDSKYEFPFFTKLVIHPDSEDKSWMAEKWIDVELLVETYQFRDFVVIEEKPIEQQPNFTEEQVLPFVHTETVIKGIEPSLHTEDEIIKHLEYLASNVPRGHKPKIDSCISREHYKCGTVYVLDWAKLGFAPGGKQKILLPKESRAIYFGYLDCNWEKMTESNA